MVDHDARWCRPSAAGGLDSRRSRRAASRHVGGAALIRRSADSGGWSGRRSRPRCRRGRPRGRRQSGRLPRPTVVGPSANDPEQHLVGVGQHVSRAEQDDVARQAAVARCPADEPDDDGRDDEHRDDGGGRVRASGRVGRDGDGDATQQQHGQQALEQAGSRFGDSSGQPVPGSAAVSRRPTNSSSCGTSTISSRPATSPPSARDGVVGARQRPREVQRQHPVALVPAEQLGCLRRAEQHHEHADDAGVRVVPDG